MEKQVEVSHYNFQRYVHKKRWSSMWYQLNEILNLAPRTVLEIGPGPGIFKMLVEKSGVRIETMDIDPELKPDHVGSITEMPFADNSFDVICGFQVLEHLPYEESLKAFAEICRVAARKVVISLPDSQAVWSQQLHFPRLGVRNLLIPNIFSKKEHHEFDGEHYWEINKKQWPLSRVRADFGAMAKIEKTYRVPGNPYHRFFIFQPVGK